MQPIVWQGESVSPWVLGSAQLGLDYGVANDFGSPASDAARSLVRGAWGGGVRFFDTAQAYGASETVLGRCFQAEGFTPDASVITKLSPEGDPRDGQWIRRSVATSLQCLGVERLWGLMLHRASWLDAWSEGLGDVLVDLRDSGAVGHLGVSVYSVSEARHALETPDIDILQLPCNAWDQRMLRSGVLGRAARRGVLCFVRSILLQGLLVLPQEQVENRLPAAAQAARCWIELAAEFACRPIELAFRFALSLGLPLVIGVDCPEQVSENLDLLTLPTLEEDRVDRIHEAMAELLNETILNPAQWETKS